MSEFDLIHDNKRAHKTKTVRADARIRACIKLIRQEQPESLLDIGCGDGGFLRNFSDIPRRVGLDIVYREIETDIEFVLHDLTEKMPFDEASFDAIFAGEILEHLFDTDHFLRECHRVLKPGGTLVLTTPNLCALKNLFLWAAGKQLQYIDYRLGGLGHVRYFSPESLKQIFQDNDFTIMKLITNGYNLSDYSNMLVWLENLSIWLFSFLLRGNCLIVKAKKEALG